MLLYNHIYDRNVWETGRDQTCGLPAESERKKKKSLILILQANEIKSSQVWAG